MNPRKMKGTESSSITLNSRKWGKHREKRTQVYILLLAVGLSILLSSHLYLREIKTKSRHDGNIQHHHGRNSSIPNEEQVLRDNNGAKALTFSSDPQRSSTLSIHPKPYRRWTHDFPCVADTKPNSIDTGLIYIKVQKCASTTIASIIRHISLKYGKMILSGEQGERCKQHSKHGHAFDLPNITKRKPNHSFLFTFVREPTERFVSDFFYHGVSQSEKFAPDLGNFTKFVNEKTWKFRGLGGYQFPYLLTDRVMVPPQTPEYTFWEPNKPKVIRNSDLLAKRVEGILSDYNFIGVAGRLDESLVVFSVLLDIPLVDIIYLRNRRVSGGYDLHPSKNVCFKMRKKELTEDMKEYLESDEWKARIAGDDLLYRAANMWLDKTIESIGRENVEWKLKTYRKYKGWVQDMCGELECSSCSATGKYIGENDKDSRCNRKYCLSKVVAAKDIAEHERNKGL